jgi:hypothetical protein
MSAPATRLEGRPRGPGARPVIVMVAGLILAACAHGARTRDEMPPSLVLRDVFFTSVLTPGGRTYTTPYELGPRLRRFDADRDDKLVLIAVFDKRYTVNVRAALFRPDGHQHGAFEERLNGSSDGTWQTIRRWWSLDRLRPWPGEWHVKLWIDDRPMGRYYFVLGPEQR